MTHARAAVGAGVVMHAPGTLRGLPPHTLELELARQPYLVSSQRLMEERQLTMRLQARHRCSAGNDCTPIPGIPERVHIRGMRAFPRRAPMCPLFLT